MIKKTLKKIFRPLNKKWEEIEYFDEQWKERIKIMSLFITNEEKIIDIGCGMMWLKEYIDKNKKYVGIDYKDRGGNIICDINADNFPEINGDLVFASGVLEYIIDYKKFIKNICSLGNKTVIISYCATDFKGNSNIKNRKALSWVNNLSILEINVLFNKNNFYQESFYINFNGNYIFKFSKK